MRPNWMECDKSITDLLNLLDDVSLLKDVVRYIEGKDESVVNDAFNYAKNKRNRELHEIYR